MNELEKYILVLAWAGSVISFVMIGLIILGGTMYNRNKLERLSDELKGIRRTFPMRFWPYVFLFTLAYLITHYCL